MSTKTLVFTFGASLLLSAALPAQAPTRLSLDEAVSIALRQNAGLAASRQQVRMREQQTKAASRSYLPSIGTEFTYQQNTQKKNITFAEGSLGEVEGGPFPTTDIALEQGGQSYSLATTTLQQPVTQIFKIRQGQLAARADERAAEASLRGSEQEIAVNVERVYLSLLVAGKQRQAAALKAEVAGQQLKDREHTVSLGSALPSAAIEGRSQALEAARQVLAAEDQVADLSADLADMLGLAPGTTFELVAPTDAPESADTTSLASYVERAIAHNADLESVRQQVRKAESNVRAERTSYIPDVGVYARHTYQDAVAFLPKNDFSFGVSAKWTLFDFGNREATIGAATAGLAAARFDEIRSRGRLTVDVEKSYRKVQRSWRSVEVATQAYALRTELARVMHDQQDTGIVLAVEARSADAALINAEADLLSAKMEHRLAIAELRRLVGEGM
jgi:outer membrane protein TolC